MTKFAIGDAVRYKPGSGTYGYEDLIQEDGRIPATVIGFGSPQTGRRADRGARVRIEFFRGRTAIQRSVDAQGLSRARELGAGEASAAVGAFVQSKLSQAKQ